MSPTRWFLTRALSLSSLALVCAATTASAQYFEPALRSLDLSTGSVARSPRLLGMGGVSLAVPDRDVSLDLWDFTGMPVGLASDDTTSTLDLRPNTGALSSTSPLPFGRERQNLAARGNQAQMEAVYRNHVSGGVFGLVGNVNSLRWDHPYASTVEQREGVRYPEVMPVLGGVFPRILHGHLYFAAHARFRTESVEDKYRLIVTNAAGQYVGLGGDELDPPTDFTPTRSNVTTSAYGVSTAYSIGAATKFALGIERETDRIHVTNDQTLSSYETDETRPWWNGQAALVGSMGHTFQYAVSGKGRLSHSEADWRFSKAFQAGGNALAGRGNLDTRKEKASELDARARWSQGSVTLAGELFTAANKVNIDPPNANDPTTFNRFINATYNLLGAGGGYPDSVTQGESRHWAFGWGGGASYRFGRSTLATEFNWLRDAAATRLLGAGPRRIAWNVRAGLEHPLGARMRGRVGYVYHWVDEDDYTAGNEYKGNAASVGFGYTPVGTSWSLESGYLFEFRSQDSSAAGALRQSRQNLAVQLHWAF
jgi:hypothetical protein